MLSDKHLCTLVLGAQSHSHSRIVVWVWFSLVLLPLLYRRAEQERIQQQYLEVMQMYKKAVDQVKKERRALKVY